MSSDEAWYTLCMELSVGDRAPAFSLPDGDGTIHRLSDYRGRWVLLYFYPRDRTPGCTIEACTLRDEWKAFKKTQTVVLGVSADSVASHKRFSEKLQLPFSLLADENKAVIQAYDAWGKKKFLGRTFLGIRRQSFLIDPSGRIAKRYDSVKPATHAREVLADLATAQALVPS